MLCWRFFLYSLMLGGCMATQPKEEAIIAVDPNPPASSYPAVVPPAGERQTPAEAPSVFNERLTPVRGGERVLPAYRGKDPCKMALRGESPVAKACSQGGLKKANDLMNSFVKRAAAEGFKFVCLDCHPDEDDFSKLAPNADLEFRKLLFLARPED
jgi:hypothetical protein